MLGFPVTVRKSTASFLRGASSGASPWHPAVIGYPSGMGGFAMRTWDWDAIVGMAFGMAGIALTLSIALPIVR